MRRGWSTSARIQYCFGGSMADLVLSLPSVECLTAKKHTDGIWSRFDDSAFFKRSGELENTFRLADRFCSANSTLHDVRRVHAVVLVAVSSLPLVLSTSR